MASTETKVDTTAKKPVREKNPNEWKEIEDLVMKYKEQFQEGAAEKTVQESQSAAATLLKRFYPLFKKYLILIKSDHIDFRDAEMRRFVLSFIGDPKLKAILKRRDAYRSTKKNLIAYRFNFVCSSYGQLPEDEILLDLQTLFLILAKRYKQMGRSFCGYLYNVYSFEVSRFIKKYIENPSNLDYKKYEYEDYMRATTDTLAEEHIVDHLYENSIGIPDMSWISGAHCSEAFKELSPLERKIIIEYYLEDYNDRQIAEHFGLHINTINQKRRQAIETIADTMGIDHSKIERTRKSGRRKVVM